MVENLYYLFEQITIIACLFGLYGKKIKIDILTMSVLVINMIIFNFQLQGYIGSICSVVTLMLVFMYSIYEFEKSIKISVTNACLSVIVVALLQLACAFPMAVLRRFIENDAIMLLIVNIVLFFIVMMIKNKLFNISKFMLNNIILSIILIFSYFAEIVILLVKFKSDNALELDVYFMFFIFVILVICLYQKWYESRKESELKDFELQVASVYNGTMDRLVNDVRKRQHNIKNHFNAIFSMHYTCKSYEELVERQRKYCDEIIHIGRFDRLLTIKMPVLAGFLYSKFCEIEEMGLTVDYKIELDTVELSMPMYELITIMGILIDNAKEKAELLEQEEKIVKIDISEDARYIYFKVKNINEYIKYDEIILMFKEGFSTKGKNRGIGLNIVKQKSIEYDFEVLVENEKDGDKNWVVFEIILKK